MGRARGKARNDSRNIRGKRTKHEIVGRRKALRFGKVRADAEDRTDRVPTWLTLSNTDSRADAKYKTLYSSASGGERRRWKGAVGSGRPEILKLERVRRARVWAADVLFATCPQRRARVASRR